MSEDRRASGRREERLWQFRARRPIVDERRKDAGFCATLNGRGVRWIQQAVADQRLHNCALLWIGYLRTVLDARVRIPESVERFFPQRRILDARRLGKEKRIRRPHHRRLLCQGNRRRIASAGLGLIVCRHLLRSESQPTTCQYARTKGPQEISHGIPPLAIEPREHTSACVLDAW
jgi:hypothetical protein